MTTFLAALGVLAQALIVWFALMGLAALFVPAARSSLRGLHGLLTPRVALGAAFVVASIATAGSLWFSLGAGFIPCELCWYQRIIMYPLVPVLLVGAVLAERRGALYAAVFPIVGMGVSSYHIWVENHPETSCSVGVPCSIKWINKFDYMTIPTLALTAFVLIAILLAFVLTPRRAEATETAPGGDAVEAAVATGT